MQRKLRGGLFFLLMVGVFFIPFLHPIAASTETEVLNKHTMMHIQSQPQQSIEFIFILEEETFGIFEVQCRGCSLEISYGSDSFTGLSQLIDAQQGGQGSVTIISTQKETIFFQSHLNVTHHGIVSRPSPSMNVEYNYMPQCSFDIVCYQETTNIFLTNNAPLLGYTEGVYAGQVEDEKHDYLVYPVNSDTTIELNWHYVSSTIDVTIYFQNSTDEMILHPQSSIEPLNEIDTSGLIAESMYVQPPEEGRIIVKMDGPQPQNFYALSIVEYQPQAMTTIDFHSDDSLSLYSHRSQSIAFDWPKDHALTIKNTNAPVYANISQFDSGNEIVTNLGLLPFNQDITFYPYPNVSAGQLRLSSTSTFMIELSLMGYTDANDSRDAQGYYPTEPLDELTNDWIVLALNETHRGSFTLSVFDVADTYLFYIDGWEESIHFVEFKIEGDIEPLAVTTFDVNQGTWEAIDTSIGSRSGSEIKVGQQVGRGYHILQIKHNDPTNATPEAYGLESNPISYTITSSYTLIDEGDEPWFPPDENATYWGGVVRYILGAILLIPALLVAFTMYRQRSHAREILTKKDRLQWLLTQLNDKASNRKVPRKALLRSLMTLQSVTWVEGSASWGTPTIEHTTEGLEMKVWKLDRRLSKDGESLPLLIGVYAKEGNWDLAVLRIEAPQEGAFEILNCEPRFLFRGEEVFIDTLNMNQLTYLQIDLKGSSKWLEVELNGRMDGQPFAAKVPHSILLEEE